MNTTNRKGWIDALRAIAILLVMYGHCVRSIPAFFILTSPIKMPLFFALSGYLFSMRGGNQKLFWKNLFLKLVVPWFCLALIPAIPKLVIDNSWEETKRFIFELISGKRYWFMPCLVIAEIIHFYIRKCSEKEVFMAICSVLAFIVGLLLHKWNWLDFAMINRALAVQLFFFIGCFFKLHEQWFIDRKWGVIAIFAVVYIILEVISFLVYPKQSLDVHHNSYYNLPLCLALIFIGVLIMFAGFSKAKVKNRFFSFIGQNTLVLYMWHGFAFRILSVIMAKLGITIIPLWFAGIIKVFFACLVCGFCAIIINKYLPEIVGKKRKPRQEVVKIN